MPGQAAGRQPRHPTPQPPPRPLLAKSLRQPYPTCLEHSREAGNGQHLTSANDGETVRAAISISDERISSSKWPHLQPGAAVQQRLGEKSCDLRTIPRFEVDDSSDGEILEVHCTASSPSSQVGRPDLAEVLAAQSTVPIQDNLGRDVLSEAPIVQQGNRQPSDRSADGSIPNRCSRSTRRFAFTEKGLSKEVRNLTVMLKDEKKRRRSAEERAEAYERSWEDLAEKVQYKERYAKFLHKKHRKEIADERRKAKETINQMAMTASQAKDAMAKSAQLANAEVDRAKAAMEEWCSPLFVARLKDDGNLPLDDALHSEAIQQLLKRGQSWLLSLQEQKQITAFTVHLQKQLNRAAHCISRLEEDCQKNVAEVEEHNVVLEKQKQELDQHKRDLDLRTSETRTQKDEIESAFAHNAELEEECRRLTKELQRTKAALDLAGAEKRASNFKCGELFQRYKTLHIQIRMLRKEKSTLANSLNTKIEGLTKENRHLSDRYQKVWEENEANWTTLKKKKDELEMARKTLAEEQVRGLALTQEREQLVEESNRAAYRTSSNEAITEEFNRRQWQWREIRTEEVARHQDTDFEFLPPKSKAAPLLRHLPPPPPPPRGIEPSKDSARSVPSKPDHRIPKSPVPNAARRQQVAIDAPSPWTPPRHAPLTPPGTPPRIIRSCPSPVPSSGECQGDVQEERRNSPRPLRSILKKRGASSSTDGGRKQLRRATWAAAVLPQESIVEIESFKHQREDLWHRHFQDSHIVSCDDCGEAEQQQRPVKLVLSAEQRAEQGPDEVPSQFVKDTFRCTRCTVLACQNRA